MEGGGLSPNHSLIAPMSFLHHTSGAIKTLEGGIVPLQTAHSSIGFTGWLNEKFLLLEEKMCSDFPNPVCGLVSFFVQFS